MALKDWDKQYMGNFGFMWTGTTIFGPEWHQKRATYKSATIMYYEKGHSVKYPDKYVIIIHYNKSDIEKFHTFKTKKQALAYAKRYMRKH